MSNPDGSQFLQEAIKLANVDPPDDFPSLDAASYIPANKDQIISLESNGNSSTDWTRVLITNQADASTLNRIRRCTFMGLIYISLLTGTIDEADGFSMPSGLYDTLFGGSCFIAPSCRVSSTSLVNNIFMGFASGIVDCGSVFCEEYKTVSTAPLGDQVTITVGSETGGRSVTVSAGMNFVTICKQIFCSEAKKDVQEGTFMSRYSVIGNHTIITRCDRIRNSHFGPRCRVSSSNLDCCILSSTLSKSITVSAGARLSHCIMNESCTASNGCLVDHLYMCENSSVGDCARIAHCVLGPDSSVAGGECHSSLLGPFVGFHHQSLLIASVWPQGRGNIAYGAKIGANHTGRVSDQECFPGEGIFFGLGSSIKFPSNLLESPYSIVASGTILPPQRISFPFSLIGSLDRPIKSRDGIILQGASTISPGWVIQSNPYMIDR